MNKIEEIKQKIRDLNSQITYNHEFNTNLQQQVNKLDTELMKIQKPKILESDLEIIVQDITEIVSTILESTSDNINDYNPEFEIGYENQVSISNINLDYDATEDIKTYLQTRFQIQSDTN